MRIRLLRNASLIIEADRERLLVDPMLGEPGSSVPFSFVRYAPRRNPTVPLPRDVPDHLESVTAALITHCRRGHLDHLDAAGLSFLARKELPVYCIASDAAHLAKRGVRPVPLEIGSRSPFFGGDILTTAATHGHGWIARLMGMGAGYVISLPGEPRLYLSGDTVLTTEVRRVLREELPAVAVVHAGGARLDLGKPILMTLDEVVEFISLATGLVVATHLEALNHCPITRAELRARLDATGLSSKVRIPADGEVIEFLK